MNLRTASDTKRLTLIADGEMPVVVTKGELIEMLGVKVEPEVIGTADAAEIWPAWSQETWRRWADEGCIAGAWQDTEAGPWRLPFASCRSFIDRKQRGAQTHGKRGPKGPWAA